MGILHEFCKAVLPGACALLAVSVPLAWMWVRLGPASGVMKHRQLACLPPPGALACVCGPHGMPC